MLFHQTEQMASLDQLSKPGTKAYRDANAQVNHSAESAFMEEGIETARIEKGINVIQATSDGNYVNNLETQINLSSDMKEIGKNSPDNSKLS